MPTHAKPSDKCADGDSDLLVHLPPISDETALVIYDLLESICEKFSDRYARQIQRGRRRRKREERRRRRESESITAQQALPIG
jgi:transposase